MFSLNDFVRCGAAWVQVRQKEEGHWSSSRAVMASPSDTQSCQGGREGDGLNVSVGEPMRLRQKRDCKPVLIGACLRVLRMPIN